MDVDWYLTVDRYLTVLYFPSDVKHFHVLIGHSYIFTIEI